MISSYQRRAGMGGYVFLNEDGQRVWSMNLRGAVIWYGLLEEQFGKELKGATLEEHNFGFALDVADYQQLAQDCIAFLRSDQQLPKATDSYRKHREENLADFKREALDIFKTSLKKLPQEGTIYAVDDLDTDWWEQPCSCEICKSENRWQQIYEWYMAT